MVDQPLSNDCFVIILNTKNAQYQLIVVPRTNIGGKKKGKGILGIYAISTPAEDSEPMCEERGTETEGMICMTALIKDGNEGCKIDLYAGGPRR